MDENQKLVDSDRRNSVFSRKKIHSLSPRMNYTDRRLSAKLVPTFVDRGCHMVSATDLYGYILFFLDRSRYFIFQNSSSVVLTRLSGPRSRPTASQKIPGSVATNSDQ
jgi:hypothetical protein